MLRRTWAPLLCCALVTPCAALSERPVQRLEELHGRYELSPRESIDVVLASADRERVDSFRDPTQGEVRRVLTGAAWARMFGGGNGAPASFHLTQSRLTAELTHQGFLKTITYSITGILTVEGREFTIQAQAEASSARGAANAVPLAVVECVRDAAAQVRVRLDEAAQPP